MAGTVSDLGLDRRWLSARSWGFGFRGRDWDHYGSVGERLTADIADPRPTLEEFYGLSFVETVFTDLNAAVDAVDAVLRTGDRAIVPLDSYWCPWDPGYGKRHQSHFVIVTAVDRHNRRLSCVDHFYNQLAADLPFDDWQQTLRSVIALRSAEPPRSPDRTTADLRVVMVDWLRNRGRDPFGQMESFGAEVADGLDLDTELRGYRSIWWAAPLFKQLRKIASARLLAAELVGGLDDARGADELTSISQGWTQVRLLILKAAQSRDTGRVWARGARLIRNLRDREEVLADAFWPASPVPGAADMACEPADVHIDLGGMLDYRGLGCVHAPGRLNGSGRYFMIDGLPGARTFAAGAATYRLADLRVDTGDHVCAQGQRIPVPPGRYREIALLGVADTPIRTHIDLTFASGARQRVEVDVRSWRQTSDAVLILGLAQPDAETADAVWWDVGGLHSTTAATAPTEDLIAVTLPNQPAWRVFAATLRQTSARGSQSPQLGGNA